MRREALNRERPADPDALRIFVGLIVKKFRFGAARDGVVNLFLARAAVYFVLWALCGRLLERWSLRKDALSPGGGRSLLALVPEPAAGAQGVLPLKVRRPDRPGRNAGDPPPYAGHAQNALLWVPRSVQLSN